MFRFLFSPARHLPPSKWLDVLDYSIRESQHWIGCVDVRRNPPEENSEYIKTTEDFLSIVWKVDRHRDMLEILLERDPHSTYSINIPDDLFELIPKKILKGKTTVIC
jgi:hypothetical protein